MSKTALTVSNNNSCDVANADTPLDLVEGIRFAFETRMQANLADQPLELGGPSDAAQVNGVDHVESK